jgi:hypothetical protein
MQLRQAAFYDTIAGSVRVTDLMPLRVTSRHFGKGATVRSRRERTCRIGSRHFGKGATRPLSPRADMPDR